MDDSKLKVTGSLKLDTKVLIPKQASSNFIEMLNLFGKDRPIVVSASTHAGEELLLAKTIRKVDPSILNVIVPRHPERRDNISSRLSEAGFEVILKSQFRAPKNPCRACLVIDIIGELTQWWLFLN